MISRFLLLILLMIGLTDVAYGKIGYDKVEETNRYTLRLRIPSELLAITPLKRDVMKRFKVAADGAKKNAAESAKLRQSNFPPLALDTQWKVTFANSAIISVSGLTYENQGGAHPDSYYQTIVWDKSARRELPIDGLFKKDQVDQALSAVAAAAQKSWIAIYKARSGEMPSKELLEEMQAGIKPNAKSMKNYVLSHASGQASINGIVLLYGTGEIWPYAFGDFRVFVPVEIFDRYLKQEWRDSFFIMENK